MKKALPLILISSCISMCSDKPKAEAAQNPQSSEKAVLHISQEERHKHVVFIQPQKVLEQSEEFISLKKSIESDMNTQVNDLQKKAQQLSDEKQELQNEYQDLQNGGQSKFKKEESFLLPDKLVKIVLSPLIYIPKLLDSDIKFNMIIL